MKNSESAQQRSASQQVIEHRPLRITEEPEVCGNMPVVTEFAEPWRVDVVAESFTVGNVLSATGQVVVDPYGSTLQELADEDRYMRRIVACVNFCQGMETGFLEALTRSKIGLREIEQRDREERFATAQVHVKHAPELSATELEAIDGGAE
jgi:hypothetical protein